MRMIRLTEFLPHVLPYAPGCPEFVAEQNLRLAAIDLCKRTKCWRHVATVTTSVSVIDIHDDDNDEATPVTETTIAPDYATVHQFEDVYSTDLSHPLDPVLYSDILGKIQTDPSPSVPRCYSQVNENTITLYPAPASPITLTVSSFLAPRSGTRYGTDPLNPLHDYYNQVPDFFLNQHADCIAKGALGRILMLPGQPFTDPATAVAYAAEANEKMKSASMTGHSGQQKAPLRTKASFF